MFGIPREWTVSSITSSYPGEGSERKPEEFISCRGSNDTEYITRYEYNKMIEIGTNRWTPTGGGIGTVIIQCTGADTGSEIVTGRNEFSKWHICCVRELIVVGYVLGLSIIRRFTHLYQSFVLNGLHPPYAGGDEVVDSYWRSLQLQKKFTVYSRQLSVCR